MYHERNDVPVCSYCQNVIDKDLSAKDICPLCGTPGFSERIDMENVISDVTITENVCSNRTYWLMRGSVREWISTETEPLDLESMC